MTRLTTLMCAALTAALLAGCAPKKKPMTMSNTPSADQVEGIRMAFKSAFPMARVGVVTAAMADQPYALVGEIETAGITDGAIVSFLDADQTVIANGKVVKVEPGSLTVMYDAGMRKPMTGDAAVKF